MDKFEFNLKIDQLKRLVHEEDYYTALKIVRGIDWDRVKNSNLLLMAATVYEKNDDYDGARTILEHAYQRAPNGKRILFKLCELSVKTGDLRGAEDYYYEFRQTDPQDINNYLLQYMILKARHAPYDRQLQPLELFCRDETDERWLYELACTYDYAGKTSDCVKTCDKIALMFGDSRYGLKALRLKMRYAVLTDVQKNMIYPRGGMPLGQDYDRDYADMDRAGSDMRGSQRIAQTQAGRFDEYGYVEEPDPKDAAMIKTDPVEEYEDTVRKEQEAKRNSDAMALVRYENEDEEFEAFLSSVGVDSDSNAVGDDLSKEALEENSETEPTQQETAVQTDGKLDEESPEEKEDPRDGRQMELNFDEGSPKVVEAPITKESKVEISEEPAPRPQPKPPTIDRVKEGQGRHLIVEAIDADTGLKIAINELKRIHTEFHLDHASIKTDAAKLNSLGWTSAILERIRDKDFVIENAGGLSDDILGKIYDFVLTDKTGAIVVLIDDPDGMDHIEEAIPELFDVCAYVSDIEDEYEEDQDDYKAKDVTVSLGNQKAKIHSADEEDQFDAEGDLAEDAAKTPKKRSLGEAKERYSSLKDISARPGEEMESDDFAQYCMQYAKGIDCSISGTSMLALYERIELMEEDGIPLTKETAEQLIEETADRAEKPPIGQRLKGMFHSKYDKNGCLILKESDFIY